MNEDNVQPKLLTFQVSHHIIISKRKIYQFLKLLYWYHYKTNICSAMTEDFTGWRITDHRLDRQNQAFKRLSQASLENQSPLTFYSGYKYIKWREKDIWHNLLILSKWDDFHNLTIWSWTSLLEEHQKYHQELGAKQTASQRHNPDTTQ